MKLENEILIIDDAPEVVEYVELILSEDAYNFSSANNGEQALKILAERSVDLILLDVTMPDMDGFEVCRRIKEQANLKDIPVIFLTASLGVDAFTDAFKVGAVDYITKPFNAAELLARVKNHIDLYNTKKSLEFANHSLQTKLELKERRLISEIEDGQREMIYILTELVEASSDETGKHIRRVAKYSRLLAYYHPLLSIEDEEIISHVAPMHDIGKVCIPSEILHNKGRLTEAEFEIMKSHTVKAHEFFKGSDRRLMKATDISALQHHEHWDGNGYPYGLKGDKIHVYGRIVAIADVFDALTHKRQYKEAWPIEDALKYIEERSGTQFDPTLVELFLVHADEFIQICEEQLPEG